MINCCERSPVRERERKFHFVKFMQIIFGCTYFDQSSYIFQPFRRHRKSPDDNTPVDDHAMRISLNIYINLAMKKKIESHCRIPAQTELNKVNPDLWHRMKSILRVVVGET